MADDPIHYQVDAIVGAAIKALAESGADDAFVGAFAARHRAKVTKLLGLDPTQGQEAPDLLSLVTQAVHNALASGGGVQKSIPTKRSLKRKVQIVTVEGRRTSVSLSTDLLTRVESAAGGKKECAATINGIAASAPVGTPNRSGWIEERLLGYLQLADQSTRQSH